MKLIVPVILLFSLSLSCNKIKHQIKIDGCSCNSSVTGIYLPNCFTPDDNGYNDLWKARKNPTDTVKNYHLVVRNDKGDLLFESYDFNQSWDGRQASGKHKGSKRSGVFDYTLDATLTTSGVVYQKECITVITDVSKYKVNDKTKCNTDAQFTGTGFDNSISTGESW